MFENGFLANFYVDIVDLARKADVDLSKTPRTIFVKFSPDILLMDMYDPTKFGLGGRNGRVTFGGRYIRTKCTFCRM